MTIERRWRIVYNGKPDPDDLIFTSTEQVAQNIAVQATAASEEYGGPAAEALIEEEEQA